MGAPIVMILSPLLEHSIFVGSAFACWQKNVSAIAIGIANLKRH
jgi:hypothetical protein